MFVDEEKLLSLWIRRDAALRHLDISSIGDKQTVSSIFDAIAGSSAGFVRSCTS